MAVHHTDLARLPQAFTVCRHGRTLLPDTGSLSSGGTYDEDGCVVPPRLLPIVGGRGYREEIGSSFSASPLPVYR